MAPSQVSREEDDFDSALLDLAGPASGGYRARNRAPAKRAKTYSTSFASKKNNQLQKPKSRQKKSLSLLLTMPLDVLYETFGQLNPKDILSLARTSKTIRERLMSRSALTVWKAAREHLDVPEPPSDMSEPAWAALLFGNVCHNCGAKNVQNVDFLLRKRLCLKCRKSGIVVESRLKTNFPALDRSILDLIPHTDIGGWANSRSNSRFFWKEDVERMIQTVATQEQTADKMEEFKEERKKLVKSVQFAARECREWVDNQDRERQMDKEILIEKRREAICKRFVELGYDEQDLTCLTFDEELRTPTQLTERTWQRIRPTLEPMVRQRQEQRIELELTALWDSRISMVDDLYEGYKRSLTPPQWKYLPGTHDICMLEPFARLIRAPAEPVISQEDFQQWIDMLPEMLSSLSEQKRKYFATMFPVASSTQASDENPQGREILDTEASSVPPIQNMMELATSVLECHGSYGAHEHCGLVGVEEFMTHHCDSEWQSYSNSSAPWLGGGDRNVRTKSIKFSVQGAKTASLLVQLAGLDPTTASTFDMDEKDHRFTCSRCSPRPGYHGWTADGYSWRRAISHDIQNYHRGKTWDVRRAEPCSWKILSNAIGDELKAKEVTDPKWDQALWTCGRCSIYMTDLQHRHDIVLHLATEHAIVEPEEPSDLFVFEQFPSDFTERIAYSVPGPWTPSRVLV
ncbi:hypothetical protein GALMADRAFT_145151 [Galerina marginata CBS 339.88]|uniref:F-box domain-containing protein n=1 Tax=Galerina marginata (strain CBS 339.88) TaxID=685588 RepID=A0A067SFL8_GALM3|nr:hypothetical protein GALMADRAFT_145151 [Galerina marginata CBS 339.88]